MRSAALFLFLILSLNDIAAQSGSLLQRKVSVRYTNTSIEDILKSLETEDLSFVYSPEIFDVKRRVSINKQNTSLLEVLQTLFTGQEMEARTMQGQVLLRKKLPNREPVIKDTGKVAAIGQRQYFPKALQDSSVNRPKNPVEPDSVIYGLGTGQPVLPEQGRLFVQTTKYFTYQYPKPYKSAVFVVAGPQVLDFSPFVPKQKVFNTEENSVWDQMALQNKRNSKAKEKQEEALPKERKFRMSLASYVGYTEIDDRAGILTGGRVSYFFSPHFGMGVAGHGFQTVRQPDAQLGGNYMFTGGYGGLVFEYALFPHKPIHINIPLTIGAGGYEYSSRTTNPVANVESAEAFFVFEPGLELEINVTSFMRINIGASYRDVSGAGLFYSTNQQPIASATTLEGMNYGIALKFGWF
ncbi:STN domain-containing protein [Roseivirga thermotolerans]|uniref:Secretin/TonB short N-terminal domain-containing protein n=1 Tax=Roseivirga thermotolerans TaxID=1758176 RepID=A0ABQ3I137_9BACT|nr:STN domain-containing protein [Roseivirga thermotolerans]GHE54497.1 hypothetical protein GCM10011340_06400 [Roseivirga thermotolerans]